MDKDGMILVSDCCNATVRKKAYKDSPGLILFICNTCEKVCKTVKRKSSNAE